MILSTSVTVGQITFVIRVAIQILAYGGAALLGLILLGNAPRVANVDTYDLINRVVGASTQTKQTATWIYRHLRHKGTHPSPSTNLLLIFSQVRPSQRTSGLTWKIHLFRLVNDVNF